MKTTIAKKAINNGRMLISKEQARYLFHDFDAEKISFADSSTISAITPRTPIWGAPIMDVAEIIPDELLTIVLDNTFKPSLQSNIFKVILIAFVFFFRKIFF